jgi:hypothetical protein
MANTIIEGIRERIANAAKMNQSLGIIVPENNYESLLEAVFNFMQTNTTDRWTYVTITKPYDIIDKTYHVAENKNIKFIDTISRAAGIAAITQLDQNCVYVESPTLLEKITMEIMDTYQEAPEEVNKYLILDSLSSLLIYNDPGVVTEFFTHLINRTRLAGIHSISFAIGEEMDESIRKIVYLKNDKIIQLKESFI